MTDQPDRQDGDGLRSPAELELLAFNAIHAEAEKHWLAYLGADNHTAVEPPKDRLEYWIAAVAIAVTRKSPTREGAEGADTYRCDKRNCFYPVCDCRRVAPPKPAPDAMWEALQKIKNTPIPLGHPARDRYVHEIWKIASDALSASFPAKSILPQDTIDRLKMLNISKDELYAVLSKSIPQDMIEGIWQEISNALSVQPGAGERNG